MDFLDAASVQDMERRLFSNLHTASISITFPGANPGKALLFACSLLIFHLASRQPVPYHLCWNWCGLFLVEGYPEEATFPDTYRAPHGPVITRQLGQLNDKHSTSPRFGNLNIYLWPLHHPPDAWVQFTLLSSCSLPSLSQVPTLSRQPTRRVLPTTASRSHITSPIPTVSRPRRQLIKTTRSNPVIATATPTTTCCLGAETPAA